MLKKKKKIQQITNNKQTVLIFISSKLLSDIFSYVRFLFDYTDELYFIFLNIWFFFIF